ncbi:MAG: phage tail tape measure protein [Lachnospiraceae bacterium]|jgi:hypothetical protein|nr:phage tail tape measure protein [Lachnospiraceae bacterium]
MSNTNGPNNPLAQDFSVFKKQFLSDSLLVHGIKTLANMKGNVIQLDDALKELARTSNMSAQELKSITEESFRLGDAAGKTGMEALSYITSASKAGYDMKESLALTEEALKMSNISLSIDNASVAIEHMKRILDGFGKDTSFASNINDALTSISNTGDVDFDTLTAGASKLATSAGAAGMSFEEMLGLLTGAYEILGNMDEVTNGELTLFTNLKQSYQDAENVYDILREMNKIWMNLDESQKETFALSNAGQEQKAVFKALMDNWTAVEVAASSAQKSFGAANIANAEHLDSIAGKTAELQNQIQQLSMALTDSGILKFFLDLGTAGTGALNTITEKLGALGTIATISSGYLGAKGLGQHTGCDTFGCEAQESSYCYV